MQNLIFLQQYWERLRDFSAVKSCACLVSFGNLRAGIWLKNHATFSLENNHLEKQILANFWGIQRPVRHRCQHPTCKKGCWWQRFWWKWPQKGRHFSKLFAEAVFELGFFETNSKCLEHLESSLQNKTRFELSVKFGICPQGSSLFPWLSNYSTVPKCLRKQDMTWYEFQECTAASNSTSIPWAANKVSQWTETKAIKFWPFLLTWCNNRSMSESKGVLKKGASKVCKASLWLCMAATIATLKCIEVDAQVIFLQEKVIFLQEKFIFLQEKFIFLQEKVVILQEKVVFLQK